MEKLRLIHDSEVETELGKHGVHVHRYALNMPGLYLFVGVAIACYVGCGVLWFGGFMSQPGGLFAFVFALIAGIILSLNVSYWKGIGDKRFVALSDDYLMVGEDKTKMWQISWQLLDAEKLGFAGMAVSKAQGKLRILVAGESIPLLLYSPFAHLEDPQGFMLGVLTRLETNSEESEDSAAQ